MDEIRKQVKGFSEEVMNYILILNKKLNFDDTPRLEIKHIDIKNPKYLDVKFKITDTYSLNEYLSDPYSGNLQTLENDINNRYNKNKDSNIYSNYVHVELDEYDDNININYALIDHTTESKEKKSGTNQNLKSMELSNMKSEIIMTISNGIEYKINSLYVGTLLGRKESEHGYIVGDLYVVTNINTRQIKEGGYKGCAFVCSADICAVHTNISNKVMYNSNNCKKINIHYHSGIAFWEDAIKTERNVHDYYFDV